MLFLRDWVRLTVVFSVLGLLLFSGALFSWYASDDFLHYATVIEGGLPFWPGPAGGGFLRPLVGLSLWLDYRIWGLNPLPAHLINVAFHVANSLLVIKLARVVQAVQPLRSHFGPMAAGLLFLVLGCHAEAVSWISCRGDVLAAFFVLLMLIAFCRAVETGHSQPWIASLSFLALALLSKESAFAAPFLALLCLLMLRHRRGARALERSDFIALLLHVFLLACYFLLRRSVLGGFVGGYGAHGHLRAHPDLVAQSLGHFLWRALFPPLPNQILDVLPAIQGAVAIALLAGVFVALSVLAWRAWRRPSPVAFCVLAFFSALLPVFNVRVYLSEIEGERYLYLASVFAAMGIAFGLVQLRRTTVRVALLSMVLALQALVLVSGVHYWNRASAIARSIVEGIQSQRGTSTLLLVNKPDTYKGALVFRTGLPESLKYFGSAPLESPAIEALFAAGLYQSGHAFTCGPALDGPPGALRLRALDATSGFSEEDRQDRIEVLRKDSDGAVFVFREPLRDVAVFYYDADGVRSVEFTELTSEAPIIP